MLQLSVLSHRVPLSRSTGTTLREMFLISILAPVILCSHPIELLLRKIVLPTEKLVCVSGFVSDQFMLLIVFILL